MMSRVVRINRDGLDRGLCLLIFPEGTRSRRLGKGHTGAAQIILHPDAPVVPVGCNGSNRCYAGDSPWSRGGEIVYRVGAPLAPDGELARFRIAEPFVPYTADAARHEPTFRALTDLMMTRIAAQLDPEYLPGPGDDAGGPESGARRFL
jgi:1-acyl-sn-glycerol-3-phosphate acyltransferase